MAGVKGLGHVVLRVRELERSESFYRDVLGMRVTARLGRRMSFLAAREGVSHEVALLALGPQAPGPDPQRVGLYHVAFQVDSLEELERFYARLQAMGVPVVGIGDHGISVGVYFLDPDGNEIEVFYELPPEEWPRGGPLFAGRFPYPFPAGAEVRS